MYRLIALIAALALVLAACGGSSAPAATVNGTEISVGELDALRPGGSSDAEQVANDLYLLVTTNIVTSGMADLGIEVTEEDLAAERENIVAGIEAQGTSFDDFKEQNQITDDLVDIAVEQQVAQEKLLEYFSAEVEVSDADIEDQYNIELQSRSTVCAAHILIGVTDTGDEEADAEAEAEAEALANEVFGLASEEGADFASLAQEYSTGPSGPDGGDLGCAAPSSYVPTFGQATLDATVGEPYGPVKTEFGWHVILVNDRTVPGIDDTVVNAAGEEVPLRDELTDNIVTLRGSEALSDWFESEISAAEVTIEPDYGTWSTDASGNLRVLPPGA